MKKDHISGSCRLQNTLYSFSGRHRRLPVLASVSTDEGKVNRIVHLLIIIDKGRPEEFRLLSGNFLNPPCRFIDLRLNFLRRKSRHRSMRQGMILNGASHVIRTLYKILRLFCNLLSDQEEACLHVIFFQNIQNLIRNADRRPVIKGQCCQLLLFHFSFPPLSIRLSRLLFQKFHHVVRRQLLIGKIDVHPILKREQRKV